MIKSVWTHVTWSRPRSTTQQGSPPLARSPTGADMDTSSWEACDRSTAADLVSPEPGPDSNVTLTCVADGFTHQWSAQHISTSGQDSIHRAAPPVHRCCLFRTTIPTTKSTLLAGVFSLASPSPFYPLFVSNFPACLHSADSPTWFYGGLRVKMNTRFSLSFPVSLI